MRDEELKHSITMISEKQLEIINLTKVDLKAVFFNNSAKFIDKNGNHFDMEDIMEYIPSENLIEALGILTDIRDFENLIKSI